MKRILVTGGAGFIGSHVVKRLIAKKKVELHVLASPQSDLWRIADLPLHLHRASLAEDYRKLEPLLKEIAPQQIFHLAAHGASRLHRDPVQIFTSNAIGTFHLLMALQSIDFESFLHVGGSSEYGHQKGPIQEGRLLEPVTFYGATKACSTLLVQQFANMYQRPIAIARLFSVYGPQESSLRLIPTAIEAARTGKPLRLTPPGYARDFLFVEDAVEALLLFSQNIPKRGEIIHFGTGIQTTNEEVIALIEELTGKKIDVLPGTYPPHPSDTFSWCSNIEKAKKLLGWMPRHSLREGLKKTLLTGHINR